MAPSNLGYSLREAGSHFFRNWTSSLGAVFTIFLSLFIIGLFVIGSAMVSSVIGDIEQTVTITAFISDNATDEDIEAFRDELETWDNVANIEFKTKEDALEDYRRTMSDHAEATISALDGENPLPRSFVIQMQDSSQVEDTANRIKSDELYRKIVDDDDPDVDDVDADVNASVRWGQEEVSVLFEVTHLYRVHLYQQHDSPLHHRAPPRNRYHAPRGRLERLHPRAVYHRGRDSGAAGLAFGDRRARAHAQHPRADGTGRARVAL